MTIHGGEQLGIAGQVAVRILTAEQKFQTVLHRCAMLALPAGAETPSRWPLPELKVSATELRAWRERLGLAPDGRPVVVLAPGAVGPSKRWPAAYYAELAQRLAAEGTWVWVIGGPGETEIAAEIVRSDPGDIRDLTGPDLRNAILALAAANTAVSNDSGLLHVAAALRPTRACGLSTLGLFADFEDPFPPVDGEITVPAGPGLGV